MHASCEQRRGVGMPQGMDGHACLGDPGPGFGVTDGALDPGATPGRGSRRAWLPSAPSGGKAPGFVPGGVPVSAEQCEGLFRQGDVPVFGALAAVDMDLEALAIDVRDLRGEGCMEPQSSARDGGQVDRVRQGGGG
jgi:hypothetical protein